MMYEGANTGFDMHVILKTRPSFQAFTIPPKEEEENAYMTSFNFSLSN